jgi:hypothetical protein
MHLEKAKYHKFGIEGVNYRFMMSWKGLQQCLYNLQLASNYVKVCSGVGLAHCTHEPLTMSRSIGTYNTKGLDGGGPSI